MDPEVPTGNTGEIVRQYYDHLYSIYLSRYGQNYTVHADTLLWFVFWVFLLSAGFYAYTHWQRTTRAVNEPYPVESYDGHIEEGNGPVGTFLTLFFIGMFILLVTITILNLVQGQIY